MATLGYGDLFPISYGGRVVGMIGCFWGVFILSTMVVILNQLLDFTPGEKKSFAILIRMKLKDELKVSTVDVIMSSQKHKYERARDETDFKALSGAYTIFRKNIFQLKRSAKQVQLMRSGNHESEDLARDITEIHRDLDRLMAKHHAVLKVATDMVEKQKLQNSLPSEYEL